MRYAPVSPLANRYGPVPVGTVLVSVPDLTMGTSKRLGRVATSSDRVMTTAPSQAVTELTQRSRAP